MVATMARQVDPRRLAEVTLAAAVRSQADAVFLEPGADPEETFTITFERAQQTVARLEVDALSGAATIARLAFIASIDLAGNSAQSAVVQVRSGSREADVVITIRPGAGLRADLMMVPKQRAPRGASAAPKTGDTIGNYRLGEMLGEGGMGTVYRVEHTVLGRQYALKVLRPKVVE